MLDKGSTSALLKGSWDVVSKVTSTVIGVISISKDTNLPVILFTESPDPLSIIWRFMGSFKFRKCLSCRQSQPRYL